MVEPKPTISLLEAALWYAAHGLPVFPCRPRGKEPACEHGFKDATADEARLREWWGREPTCNIGLPTGGPSGRIVLDVDPRNGGEESLDTLVAKYGGWPETAEAITGGGGRHLVFAHAGPLRCCTVAQGLDVKADGGYVIVAPSVHPSGRLYSWDGLAGVNSLLAVAEAPGWLLRLVRNGGPSAPKAEERIPQGQRNTALTRMAGAMRRKGMSVDAIQAALAAENRSRCDPPLPEEEVRRIAQGVQRYAPHTEPAAKEQPRTVGVEELMALAGTPTKFLIADFLTGPGAWLVVGSQKAGKTLLAVQMALSYQAGVPLLARYKTLESRPVLIVEQDDPFRELAVKDIVAKSPVAAIPGRFFATVGANFTLGPELVRYLQAEIPARDLGLVVLDSYTKMRPIRSGGADIVKVDLNEIALLDALAKKLDCVILLIHHPSHGNAALDWSDQAAGSYALGMAAEGLIHICRFPDSDVDAPERLIRVRGRRLDGLALVARFRRETWDYECLLEGPASSMFPEIQQMRSVFGNEAFTPKRLQHEIGSSRATCFRLLRRLVAGGVVYRAPGGEYAMRPGGRP